MDVGVDVRFGPAAELAAGGPAGWGPVVLLAAIQIVVVNVRYGISYADDAVTRVYRELEVKKIT